MTEHEHTRVKVNRHMNAASVHESVFISARILFNLTLMKMFLNDGLSMLPSVSSLLITV